jgi:hypothetical protein
MSMSDRYLPVYQFLERHEGVVVSDPKRVLDAIEALDDAEDNQVRALLTLREAPARILNGIGFSNRLKGRKRFGIADFTKLERSDAEAAYGLVGKFWRPSFGLEDVQDAEAFLKFNRPGVAKLLMHFIVTSNGADGVRLITETRVFCPDMRSRLFFMPYWWAIRAASGFVRKRMLQLIKKKAENTRFRGEADVLAPRRMEPPL